MPALEHAHATAKKTGGSPAALRFLLARAREAADDRAITFGSEQEPILSTRMSPDGRLLAGVLSNQQVCVWEVVSNREVMRTPPSRDPVRLADWTARGDRMLTVTGSVATVWNTEAGQMEYECRGHAMDIRGARFSPDGLRVATASVDNTARIWSDHGKSSLVLGGHEKSVVSARWNGAGDRLVTASLDKRIGVWDTASGKHLRWLTGMLAGVDDAAISPNGAYVVAYAMIGDNHIRVWDVDSGELRQSTDRGLGTLKMSPRFSEDSTRCFFTFDEGDGNRVILADALSGKRIQAFTGHAAMISSADLTATGSRLVTGSFDKTARVWDVETGRQLLQMSDPNAAPSLRVAITPDGGRLLTDSGVGMWQVRSLTGGALIDSMPLDTIAAAGAERLVRGTDQGFRRVSNRESGSPLPAPSDTTAIALGGESVVFFAGEPPSLTVLDRSGSILGTIAGFSGAECESIAADVSGRRIVAVPRWQYGVTASIRLIDLQTRSVVAKIQHTGKVLGVGFAPDSMQGLLAIESVQGSNQVEIWSFGRAGAPICAIPLTSRMATTAAFSPGGSLVAIANSDGGAELWRLDEARSVCRVEGHASSFVSSIAFHPDGQLFATGGHDRTVRVWDVTTGKCLSVYSAHAAPITRVFWTLANGETSSTTQLDRAVIDASCADGTTRRWSAGLAAALAGP